MWKTDTTIEGMFWDVVLHPSCEDAILQHSRDGYFRKNNLYDELGPISQLFAC
jgi:hypothetical protein